MKPEKITEWLQRPTIHLEPAEVEKLVSNYPYFVPARYMQATLQHNERIYTPKMLGNMRLYIGNWLLFHEILETAAGRKEFKLTIPVAIEEPVIAEPDVNGELVIDNTTDVVNTADEGMVLIADAPLEEQHQDPDVVEALEPVEDKKRQEVVVENEEKMKDDLIEPAFAEDYFRHQGIVVNDELPEIVPAESVKQEELQPEVASEKQDPRSLMVVMSFTEWLLHFRTKSQKEKEEEEEKRAMKSMWQKEKLAAALEEEDDEIPEEVFEMAVHSLDKDEGLVSESLADILTKQGKIEKAIDMYRKLSLRNPQKSAYFAQQISILQKK